MGRVEKASAAFRDSWRPEHRLKRTCAFLLSMMLTLAKRDRAALTTADAAWANGSVVAGGGDGDGQRAIETKNYIISNELIDKPSSSTC